MVRCRTCNLSSLAQVVTSAADAHPTRFVDIQYLHERSARCVCISVRDSDRRLFEFHGVDGSSGFAKAMDDGFPIETQMVVEKHTNRK